MSGSAPAASKIFSAWADFCKESSWKTERCYALHAQKSVLMSKRHHLRNNKAGKYGKIKVTSTKRWLAYEAAATSADTLLRFY